MTPMATVSVHCEHISPVMPLLKVGGHSFESQFDFNWDWDYKNVYYRPELKEGPLCVDKKVNPV